MRRFLYITSPAGFERVVEQTSIATRDGVDMQKVRDTAQTHGIEFL